ncbi:16S rRNA (adenine(1518)-N(6)/adenine(1519)-N(6))-dimethyltransferase RsmA [Parenemella sanctibonifatiensis]|uniref:Ribosomal RNA small subunit methyltransferase A n=1 Tax=Parenemella sanctibonifatiensis TaxID=2016505 RepID=A0A255EG06_9ACTN|nr:16S rRNA (adenine(1518)-N(6)/adenine(1519)-N(6))-dimethyltransferase RsmA [Parenemella sanctibonifatiensis]OYN90457.1 16S rRNA (adenine(1518)-N(6)/adenine(1519)-N(6))-dimethyltransferase [Parenemella sanctibonifatiensis]
MTRLLDPRRLRIIAEEIGLRPTKTRGQNFVTDANTVRKIVSLAEVEADDVVAEVGPGLGSLTLGLLDAVAHVHAVEIEPVLAARLPRTVAEQDGDPARLTVTEADALQLTAFPDPQPVRVVANLPYNVAVPVLLHLFALMAPADGAVGLRGGLVMVQSEVADRMVAAPGSRTYGIPTVKLAWYASAARVGNVAPQVFWPVPRVDSGLVRLTGHPAPTSQVSRVKVFRVIDAAFSQRRKMLRGALAGICGGSEQATAVLEAAGVDPQARGERLELAEFIAVAENLERITPARLEPNRLEPNHSNESGESPAQH